MISYTFHEVTQPQNFETIDRWINQCSTELFQSIQEISYIFCSDQYLLELNQTALNHDYFTDIITFDLRENPNDALDAELYISLDRVEENSRDFNTTFAHELKRVMVHGLLHLTGLNDSSDEEKAHMREMENQYLAIK
jgi:rRNA maturation RNase YbeY